MLLNCGVEEDSWEFLGLILDCKEIKPVNPKGNRSWIFIGRTDAEAETPILWPPDAKNWLLGKDPDAGKDWRQEEKEMTEVEMVGWHLQLDGHEFEQAPGIGDGQGSLVCCSPQGHRIRHAWATELKEEYYIFQEISLMCMHLTVNIQNTESKDDTTKKWKRKLHNCSWNIQHSLSVVDRTSRQIIQLRIWVAEKYSTSLM